MNSAQPLRVVVAGAGRFGRLHLRAWHESGATIVGIVDPQVGLARREAKAFDAAFEAALDGEFLANVRADVLVIAADESTHETLVSIALENGVAVFVEKPFTTSLSAAIRLSKQAQRSQLPLVPGHISRFSIPHQEIARRIQSGDLGQLWISRYQRDFSREWFSSFGDRIHPVWESCIHDIDLALYFHRSRPTRAYCVQAESAGKDASGHLAAVVQFADGSVANLSSSWGVTSSTPSNLAGLLELDGVIASSVSVVGAGGTAAHTESVPVPVISTASDVVWPNPFLWPEDDGRIGGALRTEIAYASAVFRGERENTITPLIDSVRGIAVAEACIESLRLRAPVPIEVE